jgi:cyclopropane fatty-acyl-phospholipid synthase-like methyltransferase
VRAVPVAATSLDFFDDDYWLSHEDYLTSEQADADLSEVLGLLDVSTGALLDAPCGAGRLSARLSQLGFVVDGVDLDPRALNLARSQQGGLSRNVNYLERDLRDLNGLGPYDAILSWFNSFGYFTSEENLQVLKDFQGLLRPGGVLLINTLNLNMVREIVEDGPLEEVIEVRGRRISSSAVLEGHRLVTTRVANSGEERSIKVSSVELFTVDEWKAQLLGMGFTSVEVFERVEPTLSDPVAEITVRAVL